MGVSEATGVSEAVGVSEAIKVSVGVSEAGKVWVGVGVTVGVELGVGVGVGNSIAKRIVRAAKVSLVLYKMSRNESVRLSRSVKSHVKISSGLASGESDL